MRARMRRPVKTLAAVVGITVLGAALVACGTREIEVPKSQPVDRAGAVLFQQRCSGCHTLSAAAANGSASNIRTSERTNGPNFNVRKETVPRVLFAIANGGFSGAIMPQNIVVGAEADAVARFVARYAGRDVKAPAAPTPTVTTQTKPSAAAQAAAGAAVFASAGCGACHTFAPAGSAGKTGPDLDKIGSKGAAFVHTSIVKPNAQITKGYPPNVMPETYGRSLTKQQLDQLVAYLLASK